MAKNTLQGRAGIAHRKTPLGLHAWQLDVLIKRVDDRGNASEEYLVILVAWYY